MSNSIASISYRSGITNRLADLLDGIRNEFENVKTEALTYRLHKDESDHKFNQQTNELQKIKQTVYELELAHLSLKEAYEQEIIRLKQELEQRDRQLLQFQQQLQANLQDRGALGHQSASGEATNPSTSLTQPAHNPQPGYNQLKLYYGQSPQNPATGLHSQSTESSQLASHSPALGQGNGTPKSQHLQLPSVLHGHGQPQHIPSAPAPSLTQQHGGLQNLYLSNGQSLGHHLNRQHSGQQLNTYGQQHQPPQHQPSQPHQHHVRGDVNQSSPGGTVVATKQIGQDHSRADPNSYRVPASQRAAHKKLTPQFLQDLDAPLALPEFKKQMADYYVLFNPALPKTVDMELVHSLNHTSVVCCVRFSLDGQFLATGCNKKTQVYRVNTGELIASLEDNNVPPTDDSEESAQDKITEEIKNGESGVKSENEEKNHDAVKSEIKAETTSASDAPEGSGNAAEGANYKNKDSGSNPETAQAPAAGEQQADANGGDLYIRSVCFSPDGQYLATGAEDKLIRIWDLKTGRITKYLKGHEQDIYSLDYFPDGRKLISGSGDRTVRIWDLSSGLTQLTLTIEDGVTTVAVSPDGKLIAAGSLDRTVRVWDAVTGFLVERLDSENENDNGHKDSVYSVIFTSDGKEIASGSLDTTVKLWSLNGLNAPNNSSNSPANCEVTYVGHKDFVLSVCASPDGEYILSGSKDRGVIFWEKATGDPVLMLQGHRNSVISVSVSNNPIAGSGMFATGSGDCKARIWKWTKY